MGREEEDGKAVDHRRGPEVSQLKDARWSNLGVSGYTDT